MIQTVPTGATTVTNTAPAALGIPTCAGPRPQPAPYQPPAMDASWRESLTLVERHLPFTRRTVHAGDVIQTAGDPFTYLLIIRLGALKTVSLAANGREQVVGLHLKGDWIGFDGIAAGRCSCDAYAMDTSEVWRLNYLDLLTAAANVPALMLAIVAAMSLQLARDRERRLALGTWSADARVADFVRGWTESLAERDLRTDQVALRMTRAEIGSYLGMTLETVSRAFSRLARCGLIRFDQQGRRSIAIPSLPALVEFVEREINRAEPHTLQ